MTLHSKQILGLGDSPVPVSRSGEDFLGTDVKILAYQPTLSDMEHVRSTHTLVHTPMKPHTAPSTHMTTHLYKRAALGIVLCILIKVLTTLCQCHLQPHQAHNELTPKQRMLGR